MGASVPLVGKGSDRGELYMRSTEGGGPPLTSDEVARANRVLEVSDYLSAHHLDTPLPVVLGFLELMEALHQEQ